MILKQETKEELRKFAAILDKGIAFYVMVLRKYGIETYQSCQGGDGHSFPEPTVQFHGDHSEGFKAFAIASQHALPISRLRRVWSIIDGEPTGPHWEMTFTREARPIEKHTKGEQEYIYGPNRSQVLKESKIKVKS